MPFGTRTIAKLVDHSSGRILIEWDSTLSQGPSGWLLDLIGKFARKIGHVALINSGYEMCSEDSSTVTRSGYVICSKNVLGCSRG